MASLELRLSRRALDAYARVVRSALDAVSEAVLLIDERGDLLLSNKRFARLAGLGPGYELEPRDLVSALTALGTAVDESELRRLLDTGREATTVELRGQRIMQCTAMPVTLDEGEGARLIALRDVTAERRELGELQHRALHDDLTGLPGNALLLDRLERTLSRLGREGGAVGVGFLGLDGFRAVNDRHGHASGDRILVEVAARLQHGLRDADTVGRLGGDEFLVICDGLESESALASVCERIRLRSEQPYLVEAAVELSASLGAVLEWNCGAQPAELIERANALMYAAKRRRSSLEIVVDGRPR